MIGEALVDLVPDPAVGGYREAPGGSPFNVAIGLARLGNRTSLMARFSDDRFGRLLRRTAASEGVDLQAAPHAAERSTVATASVGEGGGTAYEFDTGRLTGNGPRPNSASSTRGPRCCTSAR